MLKQTVVALALLGCAASNEEAGAPGPGSLTPGDTGSPIVVDGGPGSLDAPQPDAIGDGGCAAAEAVAKKSPVDIIMVVDQSDSMTEKIASVKANLNKLGALLDAADLDYRLVMIAKYLAADAKGIDKYGVCIAPPLAGAACGSNPPVYRTVQQLVGSFTQYYDILHTYDSSDPKLKWSDTLRFNALKAFVIVTDDDGVYPWSPTSTAEWPKPEATIASFDAALLARGGGMFGTTIKRKYVFYPICGAAADPSVKCPTAVNNSPTYVGLAKLTGGKWFPVCDANFGPVFDAIGSTLATTVACELTIPAPPSGEAIDLGKVNVTSACGGPAEVVYKDDTKPCDSGANGWQYSADKKSVVLCGAACAKVKADLACKVRVQFGCTTKIR